MSSTKCFILIFLINLYSVSSDKTNEKPMGEQLESKFTGLIKKITRFLEGINDVNFGNSDLGRFLGYEDMKSKLERSREGKGMKKMSAAMLPLIFHVGATSTWMLLTSIMAAKSVAIGLALLVFKIAVSSAKVASFFTSLKTNHYNPQHDWSWPPQEYGHDRSLQKIHKKTSEDWVTYSPEWTPNDDTSPMEYKTIPIYKNLDRDHVVTYYDSVASTKNNKQFRRK